MPHFALATRHRFKSLAASVFGVGLLVAPTIAQASPPSPPQLLSMATPWLKNPLVSTLLQAVLPISVEEQVVIPQGGNENDALLNARLSLRASRPGDALHFIEAWMEDAGPTSEGHKRALDLGGYAAWRAGDFEKAVGYLNQAHAADPNSSIAPWRLAWLADAAFRMGDYRTAIDAGAQSIEIGPGEFSSFTARAVYYRAHALVAESPDPRTLMEFLDMHPEYPEFRDAQIELLQAWLAVGNKNQAIKLADELIWKEPWTRQSRFAEQIVRNDEELSRLSRKLSPQERFDKAREYRGLRQWQSARVTLLLLEEEAKRDPEKGLPLAQIYFEQGRNSMEAGNYAEAKEYFAKLDPFNVPGSEAWEVLREKGYNLTRLGIHQEALTLLRQSAELRGGQGGIDLLYEFLYDLGHFAEARALVPSLSRAKRPDAFGSAMLDYLSSDYAGAIRAFDRVAQTTNEHLRLRSNYWAARAELHLGDVPSARARFEQIVRTRPHNYYGILAKSRIADLDAGKFSEVTEPGSVELRRLPGRIHWKGESDHLPADFRVVEARANEITAYSSELAKPPEPAEIVAAWQSTIPELSKVSALFEIGADEEARKVYRAILDEIQQVRTAAAPSGNRPAQLSGYLWAHSIDNRSAKRGWWGIPLSTPRYRIPDSTDDKRALVLRQLAIRRGGDQLIESMIQLGRALEDHHSVRRLVQRERGLSGNPPTSGENRIDWLEAYPRPFPSTVMELTRAYNMNPYLLWALIIVESDMNPDAISRADAYGLMQVIPKTGDRVAHEIGEESFGIHDLLEPHNAIRYGAWYMGELIHKFQNQDSLGLASYNTGPHRVARWLDWRAEGLDYDEFLETIPFPGAHNYHKRIIRFAATYQMLYEQDLKFYIGLGLDPTYDPKINF